jgi:putative oxidoreductase
MEVNGISRLEPYVLSIMRIMAGLLFMEHGTAKLFGFPPGTATPAVLFGSQV